MVLTTDRIKALTVTVESQHPRPQIKMPIVPLEEAETSNPNRPEMNKTIVSSTVCTVFTRNHVLSRHTVRSQPARCSVNDYTKRVATANEEPAHNGLQDKPEEPVWRLLGFHGCYGNA